MEDNKRERGVEQEGSSKREICGEVAGRTEQARRASNRGSSSKGAGSSNGANSRLQQPVSANATSLSPGRTV